MNQLALRNRQRSQAVATPLLRQITRHLLDQLFPNHSGHFAVHIVSAHTITAINEQFLHHTGPTDVIAFNYETNPTAPVTAEIFLCLDVAIQQARQFHASWQEELVRYLVHGLLHLRGYDDKSPARRRTMKRAENSWLHYLSTRFPLSRLQPPPKVYRA